MPTMNVSFCEADAVKMILEFLQNRDLNISMLSVEREAGIINGQYSDDMLFLRQLILDGQWDDVIDFIQPLGTIGSFDSKRFQYLIMKHKYLELLCIKSEGPLPNSEFTVEEVVKCLNALEKFCPSKEDYSNLCLLLTLPRLADHSDYQNWNPSNARVECFKDVLPIVEKFLASPSDRKNDKLLVSQNDRLMQLLIKGVLYESCVDFCQHKATSSELDSKDLRLSSLLNGTGFTDADLSLLSWLQSIPHDTFCCPFEQKSLNFDVKPLVKPSLEASWSEQILVTPIKPKMFPHSAMPVTRPRSADLMSRSLNPQFDGLAFGLLQARRESFGGSNPTPDIMSRSYGGFHLNTSAKKNIMTSSIDKLFEDISITDTRSNRNSLDFDTSPKSPFMKSPHRSNSPPLSPKPVLRGDRTPTPTKSRGDGPEMRKSESNRKSVGSNRDSTGSLYEEYQKQKQKLQDELEVQEQKRLEYQRQLMEIENKQQEVLGDNRFSEPSSPSLKMLNQSMEIQGYTSGKF